MERRKTGPRERFSCSIFKQFMFTGQIKMKQVTSVASSVSTTHAYFDNE